MDTSDTNETIQDHPLQDNSIIESATNEIAISREEDIVAEGADHNNKTNTAEIELCRVYKQVTITHY